MIFFQAMNSLGCFKDKEKLKRELLKAEHNTGLSKMLIYMMMINGGGLLRNQNEFRNGCLS